MSHFIHTKEGAAIALGLRSVAEVNYYVKQAIKAGITSCSKVICGTEYFDVELLLKANEASEVVEKVQLVLGGLGDSPMENLRTKTKAIAKSFKEKARREQPSLF
jgi:hypothetical protein